MTNTIEALQKKKLNLTWRFLEEMVPLSSKPLKGRVEKVTPARERENQR